MTGDRRAASALAFSVCFLVVLAARGPAFAQAVPEQVASAPRTAQNEEPHVARAIVDSLTLLVAEHGVRIAFQEKTRRELSGPFWRDYWDSVRAPKRWEDGDSWLVNYIGHPIHGAAAGFVWGAHDPRTRQAEFGLNAQYWATRWRAIAWSAGYSVQFEVGPFSEASIGNVGLRPDTTGWVDYVVTPIGAFALMTAEEALDRYFIHWFERRVTNRVARASMRTIFNPSRTVANLTLTRAPWHRDGRRLQWK